MTANDDTWREMKNLDDIGKESEPIIKFYFGEWALTTDLT
jgi:hypothetical protein